MNWRAFCPLTALLTFALGVTAATIWIAHPLQPVDSMETTDLQITPPVRWPRPVHTQANNINEEQLPAVRSGLKTININDICKAKSNLTYRGYEITNTFNPATHISSVQIKKGDKVLVTHERELLEADFSLIGLFPILKGITKQLIIMQSSGGAHCCYSLLVYDLSPECRLIFNSDDYPLGDYRDECKFLDLDGDGAYEFRGDILTFADDFEGLINIASPRIPMVFRYERRSGRYYPANQKFLSYALAGTNKEIREIKILNKSNSTRYYGFLETLDVVLRYIYAGREKDAWNLHEKELGGSERVRFDIEHLLKKDSAYKFIYHR